MTDMPASPILLSYARLRQRRKRILSALTLLLVLSVILDLSIGPSGLGLSRSLAALIGAESASQGDTVIIHYIRLPQAIAAVLVGAALALAGAEMQSILRNPLASPFTLGVSAAASLGAALAFVFGIGLPGLAHMWLVPGNAFVFAFAAVMLLSLLSHRFGAGTDTLILLGIALVFALNAVVALLQFVASEAALQQFVFWTMGSISQVSWTQLFILLCALALCLPFSLAASNAMTALAFGVDRAASFGVDVKKLRFFTLLRISLLASIAVAFVGTIGFVGLVGPHIARLLVGEDHRVFLPASLLCGALILSLASLLSKTLIPGVLLPIGVVTSLVGIPVFAVLILRRGKL
ncbi:iron ABC transporter permease [Rhodobacteraceae bacterium B1Z28]|uniref:Iron ABC transporter permease n=1 Tax=Ruegeria haliotis TaxID=2747601 RepID=A0ABX2PUI2_9RHOB|nr:iron ABC transporter permease [Ruegeria haliotis]NVO57350.1 iron ABC transporter permease [Ruegeria haliotis]